MSETQSHQEDDAANSTSSMSLIDDGVSDVLTGLSICSSPTRAASPLSFTGTTQIGGSDSSKLHTVLEKLEQLLSINEDQKKRLEALEKRMESLEKPGRLSNFHYQLQNPGVVHKYERDYMREHASAYKSILLITLRVHHRGGGYQDAICQMNYYHHDSVKQLGLASVKHTLSSQKCDFGDFTLEQLEADEELRGVKLLSQQLLTAENYDHFPKDFFQNVPLWYPVYRSTCYRFDVSID